MLDTLIADAIRALGLGLIVTTRVPDPHIDTEYSEQAFTTDAGGYPVIGNVAAIVLGPETTPQPFVRRRRVTIARYGAAAQTVNAGAAALADVVRGLSIAGHAFRDLSIGQARQDQGYVPAAWYAPLDVYYEKLEEVA